MDNFRRRQCPCQLFIAGFDLVESFKHGRWSFVFGQPTQALQAASRTRFYLNCNLTQDGLFAGAPLGNDQLAAALFFERHRLIQRHDSALRLFIRWRLRGDPL
jgi:hypothetical protein